MMLVTTVFILMTAPSESLYELYSSRVVSQSTRVPSTVLSPLFNSTFFIDLPPAGAILSFPAFRHKLDNAMRPGGEKLRPATNMAKDHVCGVSWSQTVTDL